MSGGWSPTVHLFTQSRGKLKFREEDSCFIPDQPFPANNICWFM